MMWRIIERLKTSAICWLAYRVFGSKHLPSGDIELEVGPSTIVPDQRHQVAPRIVERGADDVR